MEAGRVPIHEDMPDMPDREISDADAAGLKAQLVELAQLADRCRAYLDQDRGTYGGLWKIGLITEVGGVISLIPGVNFVAGAAISGATFGARTVRLEVARQKDGSTGGE